MESKNLPQPRGSLPPKNGSSSNQLKTITPQMHGLVVLIENQNSVSGATYDYFQLNGIQPLPISRSNYIRMWKTLILKRSQDVCRATFNITLHHPIEIDEFIKIPESLYDTLNIIGNFYSNTLRAQLCAVPPPRPTPIPNWWIVDPVVTQQWMDMHSLFEASYRMKSFSLVTNLTDKSAMLIRVRDDPETMTRSMYSFSNEHSDQGAMIRYLNDDIFNYPTELENLSLGENITSPGNRSLMIAMYIASLAIQQNVN